MPIREVSTSSLIDRFNELAYGDKYIDTKDHLPFLRSVAKGMVLEIGTDVGNSTTALLLGVKENGGHLISADIKDCSELFQEPEWEFWPPTWLFGSDTTRVWDVVFIDGDHSHEGAKKDLDYALKTIKPGGLILMHDVVCPQFPGVVKAFNESFVRNPHLKHSIREGSWGLGCIQC